MFFNGWEPIGRVIWVSALAYPALVAFLRISGKRTLAKLNAFDLVVTVALGSTLATILLSRDVALAEGATALAVLIALQYLVAWASTRSSRIEALVKSEPTLLVFQGRVLEPQLRSERITREEIFAALRSSGRSNLDQVGAVVLETDGTLSVIGSDRAGGEAVTALPGSAATQSGVHSERPVAES